MQRHTHPLCLTSFFPQHMKNYTVTIKHRHVHRILKYEFFWRGFEWKDEWVRKLGAHFLNTDDGEGMHLHHAPATRILLTIDTLIYKLYNKVSVSICLHVQNHILVVDLKGFLEHLINFKEIIIYKVEINIPPNTHIDQCCVTIS